MFGANTVWTKQRKGRVDVICRSRAAYIIFSVISGIFLVGTQRIRSSREFQLFTEQHLTSKPLVGYADRVPPNGWKNAYVSFFSGARYVSLTEVVIDAVHSFSKFPILVYVVGDELEVPPEWVTRFERLIVFSLPNSSLHPWFDKLRVILLANVEFGIILEADTIIAPSADKLFSLLSKERRRCHSTTACRPTPGFTRRMSSYMSTMLYQSFQLSYASASWSWAVQACTFDVDLPWQAIHT